MGFKLKALPRFGLEGLGGYSFQPAPLPHLQQPLPKDVPLLGWQEAVREEIKIKAERRTTADQRQLPARCLAPQADIGTAPLHGRFRLLLYVHCKKNSANHSCTGAPTRTQL